MIITKITTSLMTAGADDVDGPADDEPGPSPVALLVAHDAWTSLGDVEQVVYRAYDAAAAKAGSIAGRDVCVLLSSDAAIAALNAQYRGQDKPTNVLSFPAAAWPEGAPMAGERPPLGDIIIAYETLMREACDEAKPPLSHLAHLSVHGFLHLAGFDHETDKEAERMEALERDILAHMGIPDPYLTDGQPVLAG